MNKAIIGNNWDELLADEWRKPYYQELRSFLIEEYKSGAVYPPAADIYNALRLTDYDDVKVVILGQDPYHEPGQAHGLAFSVPEGVAAPPSLVNIFKELESDLGIRPQGKGVLNSGAAAHGLLVPWAEQGVLLLNTVLTVRAHQAGSHRGHGWEQFTDRVIELLAARTKPMVFVLWGANAAAKKSIILNAQSGRGRMPEVREDQLSDASLTGENTAAGHAAASERKRTLADPGDADAGAAAGLRHLIIEAPHPSPLSAYRGFFGGRYFSRCNYFLEDNGIEPVDWSL